MSSNTLDRSIRQLAEKQSEWCSLSIPSKAIILQEILDTINALDIDTAIELLGNPDAAMMGFDTDQEEGQFEATSTSFVYLLFVQGTVQKLLKAYQQAASSSDGKPVVPPPETKTNQFGRVTVQTLPLEPKDKFGPAANVKSTLWLKEGVIRAESYQVESTLQKNGADGVMVVLGAGNQCFLSAVDCLHGLFVAATVFLVFWRQSAVA